MVIYVHHPFEVSKPQVKVYHNLRTGWAQFLGMFADTTAIDARKTPSRLGSFNSMAWRNAGDYMALCGTRHCTFQVLVEAS
jgi:hypothetical protein